MWFDVEADYTIYILCPVVAQPVVAFSVILCVVKIYLKLKFKQIRIRKC